MFTKQQREKYIQNPVTCPHCNSANLIEGQFTQGTFTCYKNVVCSDCKKEWEEVFILSNIEDFKPV